MSRERHVLKVLGPGLVYPCVQVCVCRGGGMGRESLSLVGDQHRQMVQGTGGRMFRVQRVSNSGWWGAEVVQGLGTRGPGGEMFRRSHVSDSGWMDGRWIALPQSFGQGEVGGGQF